MQINQILLKQTISKTLVSALCGLTLYIPIASAEKALSVTIKRLTMESANLVATTAVTTCRKMGIQVTATVVDRNGVIQSVVRDTLAPPVSIDISRMKAYTAANFTADTSALGRQANSPIGRVSGLVMSDGGAMINVGGIIYGAVGVSGAPSGKTDEKCAKAGVEAISEELEMAD